MGKKVPGFNLKCNGNSDSPETFSATLWDFHSSVKNYREEANLLRGVCKDFADIKDELESIQAFLKDADKRAAVDRDYTSDGVKTWVKQVREAAFCIEDIIDDYLINEGKQPRDPGCVDLLHKLKTILSHRRIAFEIQDFKSCVHGRGVRGS